jgi:hypothetical protein
MPGVYQLGLPVPVPTPGEGCLEDRPAFPAPLELRLNPTQPNPTQPNPTQPTLRRVVRIIFGLPSFVGKGLVAEFRQLLEQCPRCLLTRLGRDGRVVSYDTGGIVAVDPCCHRPVGRSAAPPPRTAAATPATPYSIAATAPATAARQQVHHGRVQQPQVQRAADTPLDEPVVAVAAMRALYWLCACSRRAARLAYTAGLLDTLQDSGRRLAHGSVLEAEADALYAVMAAQSQAGRQAITATCGTLPLLHVRERPGRPGPQHEHRYD